MESGSYSLVQSSNQQSSSVDLTRGYHEGLWTGSIVCWQVYKSSSDSVRFVLEQIRLECLLICPDLLFIGRIQILCVCPSAPNRQAYPTMNGVA